MCSNREPSSWRGFLRSWEEYPATTHTYTILLSRKSQVPSTEYVLVSRELCSTADSQIQSESHGLVPAFACESDKG